MDLFTVLVDNSRRRATLKERKTIFEKMMVSASFQTFGNDILIMTGAHPNEAELQTAMKLGKTDEYFIVFPNDGQIKEIKVLTNEMGNKKNDIYLVDKKTFKTTKVDIKTCGDPSRETIIAHLSDGVNQAPNIILDITGKTSKLNIIKGLRRGWSNRLKSVYLNYHGQWHLVNRSNVFDKEWLGNVLH